MVLLKLLIFTLTFYKLIVDLDAKICPKGQRVTKSKGCQVCPSGHFQPEENDSQKCRVCTRCDQKAGIIDKECTAKTDRQCRCREGFVPWMNDPASCYCPIGFGLIQEEIYNCSKCGYGYFSRAVNSPCQKWKVCQSGVIVNGTNTSDATCKTWKTDTTTAPISNKITSLFKELRSQRPHEGAQTQEINHGTTTPTITATPRQTATSGTKVFPSHPSNMGNHIGMTLLIFGIIGLLVLTAVTCKLHITPCVQRKPAVPTNDPLCRRPVEESGDDSLSSLKMNPGDSR